MTSKRARIEPFDDVLAAFADTPRLFGVILQGDKEDAEGIESEHAALAVTYESEEAHILVTRRAGVSPRTDPEHEDDAATDLESSSSSSADGSSSDDVATDEDAEEDSSSDEEEEEDEKPKKKKKKA